MNWRSHQTHLRTVAFSPDGRTVASGGIENIKLWDVATGKQRAVFPQPGVTCLSFSPDGRTIAAGSWRHWESSPRLWDVSTGYGSSPLPGVITHVDSIAFSHDGKTVAAATHRGEVHFWDAATRQVRLTFQPHSAHTRIAFSPDDTRLATTTSYGDSRTKVWDLSGAEPRMIFNEEGAHCIAFSPDGRTLAAENNLWDVPTGRRKATLPGHRGTILSIAFSPDGKTVATASIDRIVRLFDVATGTERLSHAHGAAVNALAFSPDGRVLVTGSGDGKLKLWDMVTGQNPTILPQPAPVLMVDFSKDGRSIMVTGDTTQDGPIVSHSYILDLVDGRELRTLDGFRGPGALSPDWKSCAIWTSEGSVRVADAQTGSELAVLPANQREGSRMLAFSPDCKTLATHANSRPAVVKVWDVPTRRLCTILTPDIVVGVHGGSFTSMAFSPDGKNLAVGSQFNRVRLWNVTGGEELVLQEHLDSWIYSIAFSPDGRMLAAGNDRGTVQLWRVDTGRQLPGSFRGHTDTIWCVAFSPDGGTLVTGSEDKTIRFWDVHTGQERMTLTGHPEGVRATQFASDGHTLATGGFDGAGGTIRLWHAAVDEMAVAFRDELDPTDAEGPRSGNAVGDRLRDAGRHTEAADAYTRALAQAEELRRLYPEQAAYAQESARSHFGLGYLLDQRGTRAEGLAEQRQAIGIFESAESRLSSSPQPRAELALGYFHLANKFVGQKRLADAEAAYRASILLYEKLCVEYSTNASYQRLRVRN